MRRTAPVPVRRVAACLVGILVVLTLVAPPAAARSDRISDPQETRQLLDIHHASIDIDRADGTRIAVFEIATYRRWRITDVSDPMLHMMIFAVDFDSRGGEGRDYSVWVRGNPEERTIACELHRFGRDPVLGSTQGTKGQRAVTCSFRWRSIHATRAVRWRVFAYTWASGDWAPDSGFSTI